MSLDDFVVHAPDDVLAKRERMAMVMAPGEALMAMVFQRTDGRGDGHPILVIPGIGAGDGAMAVFRHMLRRAGYDPTGWGLGLNGGYTVKDEQLLVDLVRRVHERTGRKVSIVGWSMGGAYARVVAQMAPDSVRQVITLGTPWKGVEDTTPAAHYERDTGKSIKEFFTADVRARLVQMSGPIPAPYTSIYSKEDGISY